MKKIALVFLILWLAFSIIKAQPQPPDTLWTQTFGRSNNDYSYDVQQTSDRGYIIVGGTYSYGARNGDVYLLKADSSGNEQWYRTFGGGRWDRGHSVQQTSDGGYILTGATESYGAGSCDIYLVKTDTSGNQQWSQTFGGRLVDRGYSVQQTSDEGYIIAGYTNNYGAGNYDVYLVKTDAGGNQQWNRTFGGRSGDYSYSVQQTTDGGYIITGYTYSYGAGGRDVYLVKTDVSGNQQWYRTFGGRYMDEGFWVRQTSDGGYIIAGFTGSYGAGSYDVYLVKTDSSGNQQWYRTFGGRSADEGRGVQQTSDGGYIISGYTYSYGAGGFDFYLVKADSSGNQQWYRTFGGSGGDRGYSVQQTTDGGYIITGYTHSYGAGGYDVYLIRVESETEQLSLNLLPVNPPIIIPAGGGTFQFNIIITNLTNSAVNFDIWTNVSIPGSPIPIDLLLRQGLSLPGSGNINRTSSQYVPASAPAGIYTYRGFVGTYPDYITARDSFTFEKSGVSEGFDKSQSWMVEEWNNESISVNTVNFNLLSVSPNPFNEKTVISFQLPDASWVDLAIYDISGREVQSLVTGHWSLGKHSVVWEAKGMASGIYFVRLKAGDFSQVQKMVLMK